MNCLHTRKGGYTPNHEQGALCASRGISRYSCRINVVLSVNGETQCDETRPSCNNCTQRAASCHYTPSTPWSSPLPPSTIDGQRNPKKRPGRPRKFARSLEVTASKSTVEDLDDDIGSASCEI